MKLSVKARVTLFYSIVLVLLSFAIWGALMITADSRLTKVTEATIETAVKSSTNSISFYEDRVEIEPDFDFYPSGIAITLYGPKGTLLAGKTPSGAVSSLPLMSEKLRTVSGDSDKLMVYDFYLTHASGQSLWVRGVYSLDNGLNTLNYVKTATLIAMPLIIAIAILLGTLITRRAFKPVDEINSAAKTISGGSDLSKRIPVPKKNDEFSRLAVTVNDMLERLERAFENERQFSYDVSHELKTPIAIITSQCKHSLSKERTTPEYIEALECCNRQAERMSLIITQLLEISRTVNVGEGLCMENINLSELCEIICDEQSEQAKVKGIEIIPKITPDIMLLCEQTLIMRMLINLVNNAIKYGNEDGYCILELTKSDESAIITVTDNGKGIDKNDLDKVFRPFYRSDKSRENSGTSFGLGLSYVKWIAQAHGGDVTVESTLGLGSIFTVTLPIRSEENNNA